MNKRDLSKSALIAAVTGIIGNRADAILGFGFRSEVIGLPLWVVTSITIFLGCLVWMARNNHLTEISERDKKYEELEKTYAELDEEYQLLYEGYRVEEEKYLKRIIIADKSSLIYQSILRFMNIILNGLGEQRDKDSIDKYTEDILQDIGDLFPDRQYRVSIFIVDRNDKDYLYRWKSSEEPKKNGIDPRFYIGSGKGAMGIAGKCYVNGIAYTVRLPYKDGVLIPSDSDYINFHSGQKNRRKKYKAFRVIPLVVDSMRLGVISFDSLEIDAFEDEAVIKGMLILSRHIAFSISVYNTIRYKLIHKDNAQG